MRSYPILSALLVGALVTAACGGGDDDEAGADAPASRTLGSAASQPASDGHDEHGDTRGASASARIVKVTAGNLRYDPSELRATAREELALDLESSDLTHDITFDKLPAHVAAATGETARTGMTAPKPGRYVFYCSVPGHRAAGMEGVLIVE